MLTLTIKVVLILAVTGTVFGKAFIDEAVTAAAKGDVAEITRLLKAGIDVNAKDERGRPLLYITAAHDHADMMKFLLAAGAASLCPEPRRHNAVGRSKRSPSG